MGTDVAPGGTVTLNRLPLKTMIAEAFHLDYWQIQGGEKWMEQALYNVVAKPPEAIRQSLPDTRHTWFTIDDPRLREMLQSLLIQRFHLKVHRATQPGRVYLLERTRKPLGLLPTKAVPAAAGSALGTFASIGWTEQWVLYDTTMAELADFASSYIVHRPVLDRSGCVGAFDYRSAADDSNATQIDQAASFMRMLEEVGLKLEPTEGDAEILIIDHAELPSAN